MDCNKSNELMNLAIDHMLGPDEAQAFEEHLTGCADCQADYDLYKSIQNELSLMIDHEVDLPDGFHETLMTRVSEEAAIDATAQNTLPLWKMVNRRYMNMAAALVFVVVFALIGINNLEDYKNSSDYATVNDSTTMEAPVMEKSTTEESANSKEEAAAEPAMESAPKVAEEMPEMASESMDTGMDEAMKEDKLAVDEAERSPEPDTVVFEADDSDHEGAPETESMTYSEETEATDTFGGDGASSDTESQLSRDDNSPKKATKSTDNNLTGHEGVQQRDGNTDSASWAWLTVFGSFIGIMTVGSVLILKKLR